MHETVHMAQMSTYDEVSRNIACKGLCPGAYHLSACVPLPSILPAGKLSYAMDEHG